MINYNLNINHILPRSASNGPGLRYTIWTQGCSIKCINCCNKDTWDTHTGKIIKTQTLIKKIIKEVDLDGVTITGGEPLDQFNSIFELCENLKKENKCIFLTTGYTRKQIEEKNYKKILNVIDIICMGPFILDKICSNEWRGSSNQIILATTKLGKNQLNLPVIPKEYHIEKNGDTIETGFSI